MVTRRKIALIDPGLPTLPYEHDTLAMRPDEAQALVASVRKSIAANTDRALQRLVDELSREHPVRTLTIRKPPLQKLPATVAEVHASHRLRYSADGMLYNLALCAPPGAPARCAVVASRRRDGARRNRARRIARSRGVRHRPRAHGAAVVWRTSMAFAAAIAALTPRAAAALA